MLSSRFAVLGNENGNIMKQDLQVLLGLPFQISHQNVILIKITVGSEPMGSISKVRDLRNFKQ